MGDVRTTDLTEESRWHLPHHYNDYVRSSLKIGFTLNTLLNARN